MTGFAGVVDGSGHFFVPPVVTDLTGDGMPELAGVLYCSAGGVGWPNLIVMYGSGPKLLGSYDLAEVAKAEHATVKSMTAERGNLRLDWDTYGGAGSNTKSFSGLLHWDGTNFVLQSAKLKGASGLNPVDPTTFQTVPGTLSFDFDSPSHNIHCGISDSTDPASTLFGCAIDKYTYKDPPDTTGCSSYIHYGGGFSSTFIGPVKVLCRGGAMFGGESKTVGVLSYGSSVSYKNVTCESASSGMTCRNTTSGSRFFITRDRFSMTP
jgi:hypothetical protein